MAHVVHTCVSALDHVRNNDRSRRQPRGVEMQSSSLLGHTCLPPLQSRLYRKSPQACETRADIKHIIVTPGAAVDQWSARVPHPRRPAPYSRMVTSSGSRRRSPLRSAHAGADGAPRPKRVQSVSVHPSRPYYIRPAEKGVRCSLFLGLYIRTRTIVDPCARVNCPRP